jgi:Fic family protein
LTILDVTFSLALNEIDQTVYKTNYWQRVDQTKLNAEQVKVLNRMLDGDFEQGISTAQYHKVAKVSKPTATRHLATLVELKCLVKSDSGGRSTRYLLPNDADKL